MDEHAITVQRSKWGNELLPLVCGIANAGGGRLLIAAEEKWHPLGIGKLRRPFETIPSTVLRELGLVCTTEPVMEGAVLNLEVGIPAAPEPVIYNGTYYLYVDGGCKPMSSLQELKEHLKPTEEDSYLDNDGRRVPKRTASHASPQKQPSDRQTFEERSVAAAEELDMTITDEYVLKVLRTNGRVTATRAAALLSVSESTVRRSFKRLKEYGFIKRIGSNKAGYWKVLR